MASSVVRCGRVLALDFLDGLGEVAGCGHRIWHPAGLAAPVDGDDIRVLLREPRATLLMKATLPSTCPDIIAFLRWARMVLLDEILRRPAGSRRAN
jgi:hypothetical protein